MTWTTTELLASLRRRGRLPDGDPSDADLLLDADQAMRSTCLPLLRTMREGYGVVQEDAAIVAGQAEYAVPDRAFGGTVEDLLFVDDNGHAVSMPQIGLDELQRHETTGVHWRAPYAFAMRGAHVVLAPTPERATGTLRFAYQERPGRLVASTRGAQVTATTATTITVDGAGAFGGSGTVVVDVRGELSPFASKLRGQSTTWNGSTVFTVSAVPDDIAVGDWVTLARESVVVPVPDLMHSLLITATLVLVHEAFGHAEEAQRQMQRQAFEMESARQALEPRVTYEPRFVKNPHSPLRSRNGRRW